MWLGHGRLHALPMPHSFDGKAPFGHISLPLVLLPCLHLSPSLCISPQPEALAEVLVHDSGVVVLALPRRLLHRLRIVVLVSLEQGIAVASPVSSSPSRSSSPTPAGFAIDSGRCGRPPASLGLRARRG